MMKCENSCLNNSMLDDLMNARALIAGNRDLLSVPRRTHLTGTI